MDGNPCADLVALLRLRAATQAPEKSYRFLGDAESETGRLGHAQLDRAACILAARLGEACPGARNVVLAYPPGLDFLVGLFGCLYAGCVPVPVALPHPRRGCERLRTIAADCGAEVLLSNEAGARLIRTAAARDATLDAMHLIETDIDMQGTPLSIVPKCRAEGVAFLQYTSGSTRSPRGVCVTHGNVIANLVAIHEAERNTPDSIGVSWLPAYHDMGLIEGLLAPLFGGYDAVLLAHTAVLQRPLRWLQAISNHRATVSGGPNFAFDACLRRIRDDDLSGLDLSTWQVAYCGSEPVRAATLQAFAERFSRCGFRAAALRPVYGLAEATLLVAAAEPDAASLRAAEVSATALATGRFVRNDVNEAARTLVSCGRPARGVAVAIVDPGSTRTLAEGNIGEILVSGPSVAPGYFGPQARSVDVFVDATIDGIAARWLRTGDLGCMYDGELYVTGRVKDVIIVRGRKLHPQDIEFDVQRLDPHRIGGVAAFGCDLGNGEVVVVLAELSGRSRSNAESDPLLQGWADEIRTQVYREHEVALASVIFVAQGTLPRTSSGKLMRHRCREACLNERLALVARFDAPATVTMHAEVN